LEETRAMLDSKITVVNFGKNNSELLKEVIISKQNVSPVVTDYMKYIMTEEDKLAALRLEMKKAKSETERLKVHVKIAEMHDSKITLRRLEELERMQRNMVRFNEETLKSDNLSALKAQVANGVISAGVALLLKFLFR